MLDTLALFTIVSWDTLTVTVHSLSLLPVRQLFPVVVDVIVLVRVALPVSGLFTVTE